MQTQTRHLLTREQAAEILCLKPQTLAIWACQGKAGLPYVKVGRHVRYRPEDVEAFIQANTVTDQPLV